MPALAPDASEQRRSALSIPPRVTIATTIYNREQFLGDTIESVLRQTFTDFEHVLWDDGSVDGSRAVARRYADRDTRVRLDGTAENNGPAAALHGALSLARGDYIAYIDSDDRLAPTALAEAVAFLDAHPSVGMVYTDHIDITEAGEEIGLGKHAQFPYSRDKLLFTFMTFHFRLLRREVFEAAGGVNLEMKRAIDYDLCLRVSEITEIAHLPRPLYYYRIHKGSISSSQRALQLAYSKRAIQGALARRGRGATHAVEMDPSGRVTIRRKGRWG